VSLCVRCKNYMLCHEALAPVEKKLAEIHRRLGVESVVYRVIVKSCNRFTEVGT